MELIQEYFGLAASGLWTYVLPFLVVLSVLVFIHEWGHYAVARFFGVRVETFSIGFGPELFGVKDKHGTRWKFAIIPLGGYVKMFGDADPASAQHTDAVEENGQSRPLNADEKSVAFFAKPVWQRALIVAAGPAINFLFAIIVLAALYGTLGKPVTPPIAKGVELGAPAEAAGIRPGDRFIAVNGKPIETFDDVRLAALIGLDTPLQFVVERGGAEKEMTITPARVEAEDRFGFKHERGYMGIYGPNSGLALDQIEKVDGTATRGDPERARRLLASRFDRNVVLTMAPSQTPGTDTGPAKDRRVMVVPVKADNAAWSDSGSDASKILMLSDVNADNRIVYNPVMALWRGVTETGRITRDSLEAIGQMITGLRSASELGGIIRIGAMAGDMAERGLIALLTFTALLSINLGLINLFPIPALDGGHLAFYAAEAVKGSPLSDKFQDYALRVGFALLIGLMLFANINDLVQIFL